MNKKIKVTFDLEIVETVQKNEDIVAGFWILNFNANCYLMIFGNGDCYFNGDDYVGKIDVAAIGLDAKELE